MSLNPATVTQALFSALISPEAVAPVAPAIPVNVPLNFSQAKNIKPFSGCFTPNGNYLYLCNQFSNDDAPTWMLVLCDSQLNVSLTGTPIVDLAIQRFAFISWNNSQGHTPLSLFIEGRSSMPQNEPCDFLVIVGQGVVT